jgi:hypothetical protein
MSTVPLQLLASEWGVDSDALAAQFGDAVIVDDLEVRHVRCADAAELLGCRRAEAARHAEATEVRNAEAAQEFAAQQARLEAIQRRALVVHASDPTLDAYGVMVSGDRNERLEAASERLDELLTAGRNNNVMGTMHRYVPQEAQP